MMMSTCPATMMLTATTMTMRTIQTKKSFVRGGSPNDPSHCPNRVFFCSAPNPSKLTSHPFDRLGTRVLALSFYQRTKLTSSRRRLRHPHHLPRRFKPQTTTTTTPLPKRSTPIRSLRLRPRMFPSEAPDGTARTRPMGMASKRSSSVSATRAKGERVRARA